MSTEQRNSCEIDQMVKETGFIVDSLIEMTYGSVVDIEFVYTVTKTALRSVKKIEDSLDVEEAVNFCHSTNNLLVSLIKFFLKKSNNNNITSTLEDTFQESIGTYKVNFQALNEFLGSMKLKSKDLKIEPGKEIEKEPELEKLEKLETEEPTYVKPIALRGQELLVYINNLGNKFPVGSSVHQIVLNVSSSLEGVLNGQPVPGAILLEGQNNSSSIPFQSSKKILSCSGEDSPKAQPSGGELLSGKDTPRREMELSGRVIKRQFSALSMTALGKLKDRRHNPVKENSRKNSLMNHWKDSSGKENSGKENSGKENPGKENPGKENPGKENYGKESFRKDSSGKENYGKENYGKESFRKDSSGKENYGKESSRKDSSVKENSGKKEILRSKENLRENCVLKENFREKENSGEKENSRKENSGKEHSGVKEILEEEQNLIISDKSNEIVTEGSREEVGQQDLLDSSKGDFKKPSDVKPENFNKRKFIVEEIVYSENSYLEGLKVLTNVYKYSVIEEGYLTEEEMEQILLPSLAPIIELSQFLVHTFEERLAESGGSFQEMPVGNIFLSTEGELLIRYSPYILDYEQAITNLMKFKKSRPTFSSFLQTLQESPKTKFRNIDDYQITVIQRLPRYVLLLTDLLKHTPRDNQEYEDLSRALEGIKAGVDNLNNEKRLNQMRNFGREIIDAFGFDDMSSSILFYEANLFKDLTTNHSSFMQKWQYKILFYDDQILLIKYKQELLELVKRVSLWDARISQYIPSKRRKDRNDSGSKKAIKFGNTVYYTIGSDVQKQLLQVYTEMLASSL